MLLGASMSLAGLTGCVRRPVEEIVPYVTAPEEVASRRSPPLRHHHAVPAERLRPDRREPRGPADEDRGQPRAPVDPGRVELDRPGIRARALRSRPFAVGHPPGAAKSWADFVTAWGQLSKAHAADGGAGLAILSESFSSPTLARLAAEFRARYPKAQWATYDAVSDENRLAGLRSAAGREVDLLLRFDRATVILALDADPLLTDPEMVRHARGFAAGRRAGASGGVMNRLYAVEGVYSLTGAMADHRLRLQSRQIGPFLATLAARLGAPSATSPAGGVAGVDARWIDALAKDLLANRGTSLIVAGDRQPAPVHAAVCALNSHLGNTGKTVSYFETKDAALPSVSSLVSLVGAMKAGTVQTLVMLGGNPVFDAPADLDFAGAMQKVPNTIALGHNVDETSASAAWHIPRAHFLESWGDARAVGGTLSVVQPLILPLFGGRSPVEVLGLIAADADRPGYDIVRDTWKPILGETEPGTKWNRLLHDGVLAGSELTEVAPQAASQAFADSHASPKLRRRRAARPQRTRRSSSCRRRRSMTVDSPTTAGSRSCPIRSPS